MPVSLSSHKSIRVSSQPRPAEKFVDPYIRNRPITTGEVKQAREMAASGMLVADIARKLGRCKESVKRRMLTSPGGDSVSVRKRLRWNTAEAERMAREGVSYDRICIRVGTSYASVQTYLYRKGYRRGRQQDLLICPEESVA